MGSTTLLWLRALETTNSKAAKQCGVLGIRSTLWLPAALGDHAKRGHDRVTVSKHRPVLATKIDPFAT